MSAIPANNLLTFRLQRNLSQEAAAKKAEISVAAYRNMETGRVKDARLSTLRNIAKAFDVTVDQLFSAQEQLSKVRFRSSRKMDKRELILAEIATRVRDYEELESFQNTKSSNYLFSSLPSFRGKERAKNAAVEARNQLANSKLIQYPDEPIMDITYILEAAGINVISFVMKIEDFFGLSAFSSKGHPYVAINTWDRISVERWIFSAAHELGHLLLHNSSYDIKSSDEPQEEEKEADYFASFFLMPEKAFEREFEKVSSLPLPQAVWKLKRVFNVSYKTVLYRLSPQYSNIWRRYYSETKLLGIKTKGASHWEHQPAGPGAFCSLFTSTKRAEEYSELNECDFMPNRIHALVKNAILHDLISYGKAATILRTDSDRMNAIIGSWKKNEAQAQTYLKEPKSQHLRS